MKNIVFLFCDELRADALGCYGNPAGPMKTPNIDSIASRGITFDNCYCNSPVCVASRCTLMTGCYPEETGVYDNEAAMPAFTMQGGQYVTFPEILAQNGYSTANFGKTHLPPQLKPFQLDDPTGGDMRLGLTREEIAGLDKVMPRSRFSFNAASLYPEDKEFYQPEMVTENGIRWIKEQTAPFFVRFSYCQPHTPIILKRGYELVYRDYPFSGELPDISHLSVFEQSLGAAVGLDTLTPEEIIKIKVYYYGMVAWIDDQIGRIIDCLKEAGLYDDTIIILSADHGALRGEARGLGKHIFNPASQRVPLIISHPDMAKGERISSVCSLIDLPTTLFNMLGIPVPRQFKGSDIFAKQKSEYVFSTIGFGEADSYIFPNRELGQLPGGHGWPRRACIRTARYRLDMSTRIDGQYTSGDERDIFFVDRARYPLEDYNMVNEPEYQDVVSDLLARLKEHIRFQAEPDPATIKMPVGRGKVSRQ